jgi:hypothetical protein
VSGSRCGKPPFSQSSLAATNRGEARAPLVSRSPARTQHQTATRNCSPSERLSSSHSPRARTPLTSREAPFTVGSEVRLRPANANFSLSGRQTGSGIPRSGFSSSLYQPSPTALRSGGYTRAVPRSRPCYGREQVRSPELFWAFSAASSSRGQEDLPRWAQRSGPCVLRSRGLALFLRRSHSGARPGRPWARHCRGLCGHVRPDDPGCFPRDLCP